MLLATLSNVRLPKLHNSIVSLSFNMSLIDMLENTKMKNVDDMNDVILGTSKSYIDRLLWQ